jgi:hypothetical protein
MTRPQLEHILRAAAAITGNDEFVVIGSQSILGGHPDAPAELRESMEADLFALSSRVDADLIDGSIGEESPFHRTFGYYAHGVAEETAILPQGWKDRLVIVKSPQTGGATGLCLEPHDLAASKLAAGREKDTEFVGAMLRHRMVSRREIEARLKTTSLDPAALQTCLARLARASEAQ